MTGYLWSEVEDMLLPNLMALVKWWGEHPPMVYAGGKESDRSPGGGDEKKLTDDELVTMLGG